jgi:hypothetical protein
VFRDTFTVSDKEDQGIFGSEKEKLGMISDIRRRKDCKKTI